MWIARDKDESLWLYDEKPIRDGSCWINKSSITNEGIGTLQLTMFPELKWEDEPVEVDLVDVNKSIITDKDCIDEVYWREVRNNAAIAAMQSIIIRWQTVNLKLVTEGISSMSIKLADALIKKLKSKEVENKRNSN